MSLIPVTRDKWTICKALRSAACRAERNGYYAEADRLFALRERAMKQAALTEWGKNR